MLSLQTIPDLRPFLARRAGTGLANTKGGAIGVQLAASDGSARGAQTAHLLSSDLNDDDALDNLRNRPSKLQHQVPGGTGARRHNICPDAGLHRDVDVLALETADDGALLNLPVEDFRAPPPKAAGSRHWIVSIRADFSRRDLARVAELSVTQSRRPRSDPRDLIFLLLKPCATLD